MQQISLTAGGAGRLTRGCTYDNLNNIAGVVNTPASGATVGIQYAYNLLNQRQSATLADGSRWNYAYDTKGEVVSGAKKWSDGVPAAGEQFQYTFDDLGNRTGTLAGGDQTGANLRAATYTANSLNEYTSRTVPAAVDILGGATANATVTVNNQATYRHGTFYRLQLGVTNGPGPVSALVTNLAVAHTSATTDLVGTKTGAVFVPQSPELYSNDLDGNLLSDGRWKYTWDSENHLITLQARSVAVGSQTLNFECDYAGRCIRKTVWTTNGTTAGVTADTKFVYDGWNLIAELNATDNSVARSHVWGPDLSGSMHGAGGVGGLLVARPGGGMAAQFACYDGNGNITAYVDAGTGQAANQCEYGPFGEPLRVDTPATRFGFTTKYSDPETGLVDFGLRYYNPQTGRWIGRDPDQGSQNTFVFCGNQPINHTDVNGEYDIDGQFYTTYLVAIATGMSPSAAYQLAYYSQLPDQIKEYSAYVNPYQSAYDLSRINSSFWLWDFQDYLHSLHGAPVGPRRKCLIKFIKEGKLSTWQQGFVIHALGDSFAHTYNQDNYLTWSHAMPSEVAYDFPAGHLLAGHTPDVIANYPVKYDNYVVTLAATLDPGGRHTDQKRIKVFLDFSQLLPHDGNRAVQRMAEYATAQGYPIDKYRSGSYNLDSAQYTPTRAEVGELMEKIRKSWCAK